MLSHWTAERLGPHIGYLPQDVELFDGTVHDNIARMDAAASDADVVTAARAAFAHELILQLPQGYDTPIGDAGHALSGGQRQRIALARALYGEPCLVVLDEPNASLDSEGEEALMRSLQQLKARGATLIVITHRPAIIASLDKVLVLRDGAVELFASRDEFLGKLTRLKGTTTSPSRAMQRVAG
jgi:ABC-type protease/lipase transport system fused ATPase/permease subunit